MYFNTQLSFFRENRADHSWRSQANHAISNHEQEKTMDNPYFHPQGDGQTDFMTTCEKTVGRRTFLKRGAGLLVAASGAGTFSEMHFGAVSTFAKQQTDNVVLQWNNAALQAIRDTN